MAADGVNDDVVTRMCEALNAGFALQQKRPDPGLAAFCTHYPDVPWSDASHNWDYFVPFAFPEPPQVRTLDPTRWSSTVARIQAAHGLDAVDAAQLSRMIEVAGA